MMHAVGIGARWSSVELRVQFPFPCRTVAATPSRSRSKEIVRGRKLYVALALPVPCNYTSTTRRIFHTCDADRNL